MYYVVGIGGCGSKLTRGWVLSSSTPQRSRVLNPSCGILWLNQPPCQYGLTPVWQFHWVTLRHDNENFQDRLWPRCTSGEENPGSTRIGDSTGASQVDVPECNNPSSVPVTGQPALWTKEMVRALIDCFERSEPKGGGYQKRLEREWLSKYPHLPQTG